ncbi:hypothetical protein NEUTE1DRAFT_149577 [Neurospora tetrasperma FGSC 2508]|uniref:Uncharacterized protein n=1 Tax=Neurospora tetrasperma (strain FGSC 2508 / ATCC MYA-4615 / P0657) TaxID=510951 RepID=F8N4S7_NEUT8|nr:uncharacterized protein NEUTE1DRAFT_149577 [Neurospora tetrasperma FGSC 2508]EGO51914.1 hypothetical protein NEUTE1DRAFT_149577 [Neurospora tetrasperma FGSC 2508]
MSRIPPDSESLLRHDLEGFSRDLLGLHTRFQEMFPVLANSSASASTSAAAHKVSQEVMAKVKQEVMNIKLRVDDLQQRLNPQGGDVYRNWIQPLQATNHRVEEEMARIREENMKRQQAEERMRGELFVAIHKMQAEIQELKKARNQGSVEEMEMQQEYGFFPKNLREMDSPDHRNLAAPRELPSFTDENVQSYTSSALVPFSSQVDKHTDTSNTKELGLDLTTRPANRGQQGAASPQTTHRYTSSIDSEHLIFVKKRRTHSGRHPGTRLASESDSDNDNDLESTTSANRGPTSQFYLRPGRYAQGTAATTTATTSRSRSPRRSVDAEFRVRDPSRFASKSESHSARRRSTPSLSAKDILLDHELDVSFLSIPSRSQPSRRTKTANELIDRHLSFIPNGWRTIIANTAKQLSAEDWDRSDARVLKKLEEHCPAFSNLEEILPDVKMAVPALRELMRELGRHP